MPLFRMGWLFPLLSANRLRELSYWMHVLNVVEWSSGIIVYSIVASFLNTLQQDAYFRSDICHRFGLMASYLNNNNTPSRVHSTEHPVWDVLSAFDMPVDMWSYSM